MRTGTYITQPEGFKAFIPKPLPPKPELRLDARLTKLLSDADRALARFDGVSSTLPDQDLFVSMYVSHEAVLSSQIEGTASSLSDLLEFEMGGSQTGLPSDVPEVMNYVVAMNYGIDRLKSFPMSLRLLREIHGILLQGVRGNERLPGEFRTSQNWIGAAGSTIKNADFVPPPPHEMSRALTDLELFLHDRNSYPDLVHCALAHAQFETIHPFLDGNGRVGRLLITLLLCDRRILQRPLLYLSYYLKAHRAQYYDRLMAVRNDGDWEGWVKFFLEGVYQVSQAATRVSREILRMRENHRKIIDERIRSKALGHRLHERLFERPIVTVTATQEYLDCSYPTANSLIGQLQNEGILVEITGRSRNRMYRYEPYIELFSQQALVFPSESSS